MCVLFPPLDLGVGSGSLHHCVQLSLRSQDVCVTSKLDVVAEVEPCSKVTCLLKGVIPIISRTSSAPAAAHKYLTLLWCRAPGGYEGRREDRANAVKVLHLSHQWFCSLGCSSWPIWQWWGLLLFWGPYQSHRSNCSSQADLKPPWGATGGGRCAIRDHVRQSWRGMETRVSRQCIYIPHVSHLTKW